MSKSGAIALDIATYYAGQNQVTHPNVISFATPWHGYRYYMAYTPYPYANGFEENPCLAVSNDLIHWEKPKGLINPIACCEELECDELKDSHLLYRQDLDQLEMWYLGRIGSSMAEGGPLFCFRKVSSDGIHWGAPEIMYAFNGFNLASESVIWTETGYQFWGIRNAGEETGLYFMHSTDGKQWSELTRCSIPQAQETDMWHGTVVYQEANYHFVWVGLSGKQRNIIYYSNSTDGISFSAPQKIVENDTGWEFLYRPCLIKGNDIWYCYYGVVRCDGKWLISLSKGSNVNTLDGITASEIGATKQELINLVASTKKLRLKLYKQYIYSLVIPRLLGLCPLFLILRLLFIESPLLAWSFACICCVAITYCAIDKKSFLCRGVFMGTVIACIVAFFKEIIQHIV